MNLWKTSIIGLGIAVFFALSGIAWAVQITVPSAPGKGYALVSTTTGAWIATTTDPLHVGSIFATSSSQISVFNGVVNLLNGFVATASSTFSNLGTGAVYTQNGLLLSHATTSASAAYQDVWRDANQNAFAQNFISAATVFPSLGTTATLTAASPRTWVITGVLTQTFKLPSGTTLTAGTTFVFNNNSTGLVIVIDNGSNVISTVLPGGDRVFLISDVSTTNGVWEVHAWLGHGNLSGTDNLSLGTTTPWGALAVNPIAGEYSNQFVVGSSTATAFIINNAGMVGINTTAPSNVLTVGTPSSALKLIGSNQSLSISETGNAAVLKAENTTASASNQGAIINLYSNDSAAMAAGDRLAGFLFGGSSSGTTLRNSLGIFGFAESNWVDGSDYGSYLTFETIAPGATTRTEKMRLTGAGNLGVASTSPFAQLSVGSSNTGTFAVSTTTNGCAQFTSGLLWITGNACGLGTVTSVAAGDGLTANPSPIIGAGTIYNPFAIATSSGADFSVSNIAYITKTSGKTTLGGVATSTSGTASTVAFLDANQHITLPYATSTAHSISGELNAPHSGTVPTLIAGDVYSNTNSIASSSLVTSPDGSTNSNLFSTHSVSSTFASSTLAYMGAFGATGSTTIAISNPLHSTTMTSIFCKTDVGTAYVGFGTGAATTTEPNCSVGGTSVTLSSNNTWNGRQTIYIEIGHSASAPNNITVTADVYDRN